MGGGTGSALLGPAARALALGLATGARSSLGAAAPVLSSRPRPGGRGWLTGRPARGAAALAVAGELVADKLPGTPSRLLAPSLALRIVSGGAGAAALARRSGGGSGVTMTAAAAGLLGAGGAAAGAFVGAAWRSRASRTGPDLPGAVAEDVVALGLAALACRRRPGG